MSSFSYLVTPRENLESPAQNTERQKKTVADIVRALDVHIKMRNIMGPKKLTITYTKDVAKGGRLLFSDADSSSPPFPSNIGVLEFDKIRVLDPDKEAVLSMLDEVITQDFPSKGYEISSGTVYDRVSYIVPEGTYDKRIVTEFVPVKYYEIRW